MANKVKVKILNREYVIHTDESEEYTKELAKEVDSRVSELMKSVEGISLLEANILVSLSLADDIKKNSSSTDNIRTQIRAYIEEANDARAKYEEAMRENRALKTKVEQLEMMLRESENNSYHE